VKRSQKNGFFPLRHCRSPASDLKIKEKSMPGAPIGDAASDDSSRKEQSAEKGEAGPSPFRPERR